MAQIRKERALATRRRIVKAAYQLFCERGYAATTMDAIAKASDVAVQTLYFTFHTKGMILSEAMGGAILGFERWDPKAEAAIRKEPRQALADFHDWFPAFKAEKSPRRALSLFVDVSLDILARIGPLWMVMAAAAPSDGEVRAAGEIGEQRRRDMYRLIVALLAKKGGLRRGVTVRRATDILLTLLSAELHHQLTAGRGWSRAESRRWLLETLEHQLLN